MPSKKKFILEKYVKYDAEKDSSVCIIQTCQKALQGKRSANIKRHYKNVHQVNIESSDESDDNEPETLPKVPLIIEDDSNATTPRDTLVSSTKGRNSLNLENYATYDSMSNRSICIMENCGKVMRGRRPATIKRHYMLMHNRNIGSSSDEDDYSTEDSNGLLQPKRRRCNISQYILPDKQSFLKCCLGLITVKNLPFSIFDDTKIFKKLIAPYEQNFRTNLNSEKMHFLLDKECHQIKEMVKQRIHNKLISLKIDFASFMEKYVFGVNIQYIYDNKMCNHTIGMFQVIEQRTDLQIHEDILNCLEDFGIKLKQIYSVTLNNGASMNKVLQRLEEVQERIGGAFDESLGEFVQLKILSIIKGSYYCAAHKINVAAHEVIVSLTQEINQCCDVIESIDLTPVTEANPDIVLPCQIILRWDSTYKVLRTILLLKDFIGNADIDWPFIDNFLSAFKPLMDLSKKCLEDQYIFGDFYRDWLTCELELEELKAENPYAQALHNAMNRGKHELFREHHSLLAALYVDPRFNFDKTPMLTDHQKEIALKRLLKTAQKIHDLETAPPSPPPSPTLPVDKSGPEDKGTADKPNSPNVVLVNSPRTSIISNYSKLTQRIQKMMSNSNKTTSERERNISLHQKLLQFSGGAMAPMSTNVLDYWQKHYGGDLELLKLIKVVLAIPAQQVSVADAYEALTTILINPTQKPTNKMLTKMYITKLNYDLL